MTASTSDRYAPANDATGPPDAPAFHIAGTLTDKDMKRLVNQTRSSNIGPTALYYAGVTAPVISAGMALMTRSMLDSASLSSYWVWLISSLLAAMAGIVWYLIFVRWSYRHQAGRASESGAETVIDLAAGGLHIRRDAVETRIQWRALDTLKETRGWTLITFHGADPLLIPQTWFGKDRQAAKAFKARLREGFAHGTQQQEERRSRQP